MSVRCLLDSDNVPSSEGSSRPRPVSQAALKVNVCERRAIHRHRCRRWAADAAVHGQIAYCQRELGEATVHDSAILHGRLSLEAVSLQ